MSVTDAATDRPKYRAAITVICANDPKRVVDLHTDDGGMERPILRRFIRKVIRNTCGLRPATTAGRGAQ